MGSRTAKPLGLCRDVGNCGYGDNIDSKSGYNKWNFIEFVDSNVVTEDIDVTNKLLKCEW